MPKPEGWSDADLAKRDRCVDDLTREGVPAGKTPEQKERTPKERVFAICTVAVEKHRRKG